MIHIMVGTKAQLIKLFPVMLELEKRGIVYNYIDTGQHSETTAKLRQIFKLRNPDVSLKNGNNDIANISGAVSWFASNIYSTLFCKKKVIQDIFKSNDGICIIHGDTLSTLISLILAKSANCKVAHIEAGLRSYNIFNPFPEEIIRILTMKLSDMLFAPSNWAFENLLKMNLRGEKFNIEGNTVIDSLNFIFSNYPQPSFITDDYVLSTIHRFENIYVKWRLEKIINFLIRVSHKFRVFFVVHQPTMNRLKKMNLIEKIKSENIEILPLQKYSDFVWMIKNAKFIITDGGSIQEESYYLNVPCILMRKKTERIEGINSNVLLSEFNDKTMDTFLQNYENFKSKESSLKCNPSKKIVDIILNYTK